MAIAKVELGGEQPSVNADFIPPLIRLGSVAGFDSGILSSLEAGYNRLFGVLSEQVEAAGAAFAKGHGGPELMSRRSDYEALRSIMISLRGIVADFEQVSARKLLREVAQPIAFWWLHHKNRHFPDISSQQEDALGRVTSAAESLMGLTHGDLCAGSSGVLHGANNFFTDLAIVIEQSG